MALYHYVRQIANVTRWHYITMLGKLQMLQDGTMPLCQANFYLIYSDYLKYLHFASYGKVVSANGQIVVNLV